MGRSPISEDRAVAARVRLYRAASGMSQEQLARALGVSIQQVAKYELCQNRISAGQLIVIARALGLSVAQLVNEDGVGHRVRMRATINLVREFSTLDAQRRDVVLNVVRALAS
jgi:transcriptional regulator with XRE-family HTH domain